VTREAKTDSDARTRAYALRSMILMRTNRGQNGGHVQYFCGRNRQFFAWIPISCEAENLHGGRTLIWCPDESWRRGKKSYLFLMCHSTFNLDGPSINTWNRWSIVPRVYRKFTYSTFTSLSCEALDSSTFLQIPRALTSWSHSRASKSEFLVIGTQPYILTNICSASAKLWSSLNFNSQ